MVKAVQPDETPDSPNSMGDLTKPTSTDTLSIGNFDNDVEFNIDFDETSKPTKEVPGAVSEKAMGGTELMRKWLFE